MLAVNAVSAATAIANANIRFILFLPLVLEKVQR
jgi:hypothetical protein